MRLTLLISVAVGAIAAALSPASAGWKETRQAIYDRIERQDYTSAYQLAAGSAGQDAESEFYAGWIALKRLGNAQASLRHFVTYAAGSSSAPERAKSLYWVASSLAALGQTEQSKKYLTDAASYGSTFYGQAAAGRLGQRPSVDAGAPQVDKARLVLSVKEAWVQEAIAAYRSGDTRGRDIALLGLGGRNSIDQIAIACRVALALGAPGVAVELSKRVERSGMNLGACGYPDVEIKWHHPKISKDLVLAVIREESRFRQGAVSGKGAKGKMQITPIAERDVEQITGVSIDSGRVASDADYNVAVGSTYFVKTAGRFDYHPILAIAAYNAGPTKVTEWLGTIGDPRTGQIDTVDWIESIPYTETRLYVKAVFSSYIAYSSKRAAGTG